MYDSDEFEIGDIVVPVVNTYYAITNARNECVGEVVQILNSDEIVIKVINICEAFKHDIGREFPVDKKKFVKQKQKEEEYVMVFIKGELLCSE